jgi:uncharacterized membrane protein
MSALARGDVRRGEPADLQASPVSAWVRLATLALSLAGLAISTYLTIAHFTTSVTLTCPATGIVNCEKVTTSAESMVFGVIPVAVIGLVFFAALVVLNSPWAWRSGWSAVRWVRLGALAAGMAFVLYLVYTELFTLDAICLWCTSIHVITLLLFVLVVPTAVRTSSEASRG